MLSRIDKWWNAAHYRELEFLDELDKWNAWYNELKNKELSNMNTTETTLLNTAESLAPTSPAVQVLEAAISTAANPRPSNIIADIELAISLVKQLKMVMSNHPSISALVKAIF